jgi:O-antigen ligase
MKFPLFQRLECWQWRLLILVVYSLPFLRGLKNMGWGFLLVLWIVGRILGRQKPTPSQPLLGASLGWLLAGAWASLWAIEPDESWKGVWDMLRSTSMIWLMADLLPGEPRRAALLRHIVASSALGCLFSWVDHLATLKGIIYGCGITRVFALQLRAVGHFNQSAMYLALAWVVALATNLDQRIFCRKALSSSQEVHRYVNRVASRWRIRYPCGLAPLARGMGWVLATGWFLRCRLLQHRWSGRFAVALIGLSLLATTGRFPILVSCLVGLWMIWQYGLPRWLVQLALVAVVVVVMAVGASSSIRGRIVSRGSFHNRSVFCQVAMEQAKTRPWTGVGLNNFKNISLPPSDPMRLATIDHAHNLYFNTLAQMGIPGFLALCLLLAMSARMIWRWRPSQCPRRLWFCSAGGVWLIMTVTGLSNTSLHHEMAMLFFIVLGVAMPLPKQEGIRGLPPAS